MFSSIRMPTHVYLYISLVGWQLTTWRLMIKHCGWSNERCLILSKSGMLGIGGFGKTRILSILIF
jgi:hypothetical protein